MKVFLDTNVWISAFATSGLCAELLSACLEQHEVLTTPLVWQEIAGALDRKLSPSPETRKLMEELGNTATQVSDASSSIGNNDARLIRAAVEAQTRYFVTGDEALLKMDKVGGMAIVSPRRCWDALFVKK